MPFFYDLLVEALEEQQPFALGIISGIKGSSPQKLGAKAAFFYDGRIKGTMGGGCLEAEIQERARRALLSQQPATFDLLLDHDFGWDDGLICGGRVSGCILPKAGEAAEIWRTLARRNEIRTWGVRPDFSIGWVQEDDSQDWLYKETVSPPASLWVAGSGHVAQAVVPLAVKLDFEVTLFDDRPALANHRLFPAETRLRVGYWNDLMAEPDPRPPALGLIVTRGHQHDALVLRHWIHRPFAFLGMIGSRRKARLIFSQFREEALATEEELKRVACPVGVDISSHTVEEIAVSIAAQLIQQRAKAAGPAAFLPQPKQSSILQEQNRG